MKKREYKNLFVLFFFVLVFSLTLSFESKSPIWDRWEGRGTTTTLKTTTTTCQFKLCCNSCSSCVCSNCAPYCATTTTARAPTTTIKAATTTAAGCQSWAYGACGTGGCPSNLRYRQCLSPCCASECYADPICNPTPTTTASPTTTQPPVTTTITTTSTTTSTSTSTTTSSTTTTTLPSVSQNQITLYNGWNLISFTMKTITSISPDNCNVAPKLFHYYNAQTKTWEDYKWDQLVGGKAYWIYSDKSSSCTTGFSGPWGPVTPADLPSLKTGYNLLGTKSNVPYSFSSTKGTCSVSIGPLYWNNVNKNWETATTFEANKGYWLYVDSDCSLV